MNTKRKQTSIILTEATMRQVKDLKARGFGSFTDIVRIAIDRMWQQEGKDHHNADLRT